MIKDQITACIPENSEVVALDSKCVLLILPRGENRKEVMTKFREQLEDTKSSLVQPVNGYKENSNSIEVALPQMKRFFPKKG